MVGRLSAACSVDCYEISAGSFAFTVTHIPVEAQHCLSTTALDSACGHPLEMIYQEGATLLFSYDSRKHSLRSFSLRCSSVAPFRLLAVTLSETVAYRLQSSMKSESSSILYDLNSSNDMSGISKDIFKKRRERKGTEIK